MKHVLEQENRKYNGTRLFTRFKAGLHSGMVAAGEIGSLKKEILFTGDVLNATARIQGLCNHFHTDLLLSDDLAKIIQFPNKYTTTSVGNNLLKGRSKSTELFSISEFN